MGFRLMENFTEPYQAKSIAEFWKRWHISLSTWFRDYVYIPLGGNRVSRAKRYRNLMIVFVLSGLWHGASWSFVIWGALHGVYMIVASASSDARRRLAERLWPARSPFGEALSVAGVFLLVSFAWIFFRAQTLGGAFHIATHLFAGLREQTASAGAFRDALWTATSKTELVAAVFGVTVLLGADTLRSRGSVRDQLRGWPIWARWSMYYSALLAIALLGVHELRAFIYFQF
jgi:D-alanyl-lipoteichoic acid acyltransferase DltB (MBOAT superfamily)